MLVSCLEPDRMYLRNLSTPHCVTSPNSAETKDLTFDFGGTFNLFGPRIVCVCVCVCVVLWNGYEPVVGFCDHVNEPCDSIKGGKFLI